MSLIFRTKDHLTIGQLAWNWARELARNEKDFEHEYANLVHTICEDVVAGRFDEAGPLRDGRSLGLRVIIEPEGKAGFIEGPELRPVLVGNADLFRVLHRIVIMKETVLDFAHRRELPIPSWWRDSPDPLIGTDAAGKAIPTATAQPESPPAQESPAATGHSPSTPDSSQSGLTSTPGRGGRRPKLRNTVKADMEEKIRQGVLTIAGLRKMPEKTLAARYGVNRETVRKALSELLSEMSREAETQFPTKPITIPEGGK